MPAVDLQAVAETVVTHFEAAPCAVVAAALYTEGRYCLGHGAAGRLAPDTAACLESVFDLASLTKPVTALIAARLERQGIVQRAWPLQRLLPELSGTHEASASWAAPLDLLMAHRAGLEAHIEFFHKHLASQQPAKDDILRRAARARRLECKGVVPPRGFAPVYSDLGYILAGEALARAAKRPLDALVAAEIAGPCGLDLGSVRWWKAQQVAFDSRVAPTERVAWRGGVLRGIVHDENAWVLAGEASAGHAGLFGTAAAVRKLGMAVLDAIHGRSEDWLAKKDLEPLLRRRHGGSHCAGFDRRTLAAPSSGAFFGDETFGHLGFTGTSLWIDPERQLVAVLLSNRVHPSRDHIAIRKARPAAHDLLWRTMVGAAELEATQEG